VNQKKDIIACLLLVVGSFLLAYLPNEFPASYQDYSLRIGEAMIGGHLGMNSKPPDWLNEMIPQGDHYYSVFPLGNILSIMPFALLHKMEWIDEFPSRFIAAALASITTLLGFLLTAPYRMPMRHRVILSLAPFFGTCLWANVAYGGSWQIAIGIAVATEMAALYFLLSCRKPFLAGFFFAVAFGNRTEIILIAPILYYLLIRGTGPKHENHSLGSQIFDVIAFTSAPLVLGLLTLWYNYARFSNPFDFGHSHIPGVLEEANYINGIFSLQAVPNNLYRMFLQPWKLIPEFPRLVPMNSGGSLFLYSPWLILALLWGGSRRGIKVAAWVAVSLLLVVLCLHGDPGGLQISSRYAMILVPWVYLLILEKHASSRFPLEGSLVLASVIINAWAMWLFCSTQFFHLYRESGDYLDF
jgi:hypothetical protein